MPPVVRRTSDILPWSLYSDGPLSPRPQPLESGGDAAPCEDTREDFGLSLELLATTFCCRVAFKCRPMRTKRSQVRPTSGDPGVAQCAQKRHFSLQGRVSCRDPTVPMRVSDAAVAGGWQFHPVTLAHGCKEQQSGVATQHRRAHPARATNPRTGGHRPKKRHLL